MPILSHIKYFTMVGMLAVTIPVFAGDKYSLDSAHSYVIWRVKHFDFSDVTGKLFASGAIVLDDQKPEHSQVDIKISTEQMNTGISKLDSILVGRSFFNTTEYPVAFFKSTKVIRTSKSTGKIMGELEIRGIKKPVTLDATLNRYDVHPFSHKKALGVEAHATIKRSDFGMTGYIPGVSDAVNIEIQVEAIRND